MPAKAISVAARQGLGTKAGVAIVEADGRRYLLGVTEHAVTVLDRLDGREGQTGPKQQTALTIVTGPVPAVGASTQGETRVVSVGATGPVPAVAGQTTRVVSVVTTGPVPTEHVSAQSGSGGSDADAVGAWFHSPSAEQGPDAPPQSDLAAVHRGTFEQELAAAASFTAALTLPPAPSPPQAAWPEVLRIDPAQPAQPAPAAQPLTRRAARAAESAKPNASASPLAGSILSPETWRQTAAALKRA